ncbi:MAG: hypothetical protein E6I33_01155 [Chloroflexi bacterium]|nr:MAG: hypothetical protein E6I33_01155 [Chloroflexota bacterium]
MSRFGLALAGSGAALVIAACGSAAASTTTPPPSAGGSGGGGLARNGAAGQLVQINAATLILSNANGDTTVAYTSNTPVAQTSTGTVADITPGVCVTAAGQKDSTGHITASTVSVRAPVNGSCTGGGAFGGFGGRGGAGATANPSFTPPPQAANLGRASGQVTPGGVNGTSVSVKEANGTIVTVMVPTTVRLTRSDMVSISALSTGECVAAAGTKSASGTVTARSLTIVPAGPNGCFTDRGAGGFGGGFGGGA